MSRYAVDEMIKSVSGQSPEIHEIRDLCDGVRAETRLGEWIDDGIFGWDEALETFFLIGPTKTINDVETPSFWYGTSFREIVSPLQLVALFNRVFDNGEVVIEPHSEIIEQLTNERDSIIIEYDERSGARSEMRRFFAQADTYWSSIYNSNSFLDEYIQGGFRWLHDEDDG